MKILNLFLILLTNVLFGQEAVPTFEYKKLIGKFGKQQVAMDIMIRDTVVSGWYYTIGTSPKSIYGRNNEGKISLEEESEGMITGKLLGVLKDDAFSGEWSDTTGGKKLKFSLKESYPEGSTKLICLSRRYFHQGNIEGSPHLGYDMSLEGFVPVMKEQRLCDSVTNFFWGSRIPSCDEKGLNIVFDSVAMIQKQLYEEYKTEALNQDTLVEEYMNSLGWVSQTSFTVALNEKNYLSVYYTHTSDAGVQEMSQDIAVTFSLKDGKVISLHDVIKPGFDEMISSMLTKQFRKDYELADSVDLKDYLFSDTIPLTQNFCLLKDRILFHFNQHEIGAYSLGPINIMLPYSEIRAYLREDVLVVFETGKNKK